ncbi:MAG: flagellar basal body rod protein FlgB [Alphaproteobacteria bacterium]|nr:flagellar basal body rod protein FlgB [Alphaproteobacteria bacterium]
MLESISLFRVADARLQYLAERQSVIARNIANADTPSYVSRDLKPFSFASALAAQSSGGVGSDGRLAMVQTSAAHLVGSAATTPDPMISAKASDGEKPDHNHVSLEEQMVKSSDNANAFALVTAAYAKSVSIMKMSIDK